MVSNTDKPKQPKNDEKKASTQEQEIEFVEEDALEIEASESGLVEELANTQERLLRTHAEMENVKRRAERDIANAHRFSIEKLVKSLLPVIDSFEMAMANESEDTVLQEGVSLTHTMLLDALAKHQVKQIDPLDEPFNPELHEALSLADAEELESNQVLKVVQKGYTLNERLLRPALVVVAK